MNKISKLTKEQEKQLIEYRQYCLNRGRATDEIDKDKIEKSLMNLYWEINFNKPYFWYCDSIWQAQIIINLVKNNNLWDIGNNLGNLWDNLGSNLWDNLKNNLWNNLGNNLKNNLWNNLWNNLKNNLKNNLWNNLGNNLGNNLENSLKETLFQYIYTSFWGQQDYYWISYYKYAEKYLNIKYTKRNSYLLSLWEDLAESSHWFWCYENICFISYKPIKLLVDDQNRLHCDNGPAIEYKDRYAQYYLHGVSVPKELAEIKKEDMNPNDLSKYKNVEIRMQFIKKLGVDKIKERGIVIETKGVYNLIDMHSIFEGLTYAPYLFMINPSTGETHAEGVSPECKSVSQAINWRAGDINRVWEPLELT